METLWLVPGFPVSWEIRPCVLATCVRDRCYVTLLFSASPDADSSHIKGGYLRMPGERSPTNIHFNVHTSCIHHVLVKRLGARTALKPQEHGMPDVQCSGRVTGRH